MCPTNQEVHSISYGTHKKLDNINKRLLQVGQNIDYLSWFWYTRPNSLLDKHSIQLMWNRGNIKGQRWDYKWKILILLLLLNLRRGKHRSGQRIIYQVKTSNKGDGSVKCLKNPLFFRFLDNIHNAWKGKNRRKPKNSDLFIAIEGSLRALFVFPLISSWFVIRRVLTVVA